MTLSEETIPVQTELQGQVTKHDAVERMLIAGLPPEMVATTLDIPVGSVRQVAALRRSSTQLTEADAELANQVRALTQYAISEAWIEIQTGAPQDRIALIKILVGRAAGLLGAEGTHQFEEMREMFSNVMTGVRDIEAPFDEDGIPEDDYLDA